MPAVDQMVQEIIGENPSRLLAGPKNGLMRQEISHTSQKVDSEQWYLYQTESVPEVVRRIMSFIDTWTMPLLDVYGSAEDMVAADERKDGRLIGHRPQIIRVVAAALVCNRKDYAQALMEERLGRPGNRIDYRPVYEYLENAQ